MFGRRTALLLAAACASSWAQAPLFFEAAEGVPRVGGAPPLAAADFDGDGDVDLLLASGVLLNDGSAHFRPDPLGGASPFAAAMSVVVADLDGDGDLDVVVLDGWGATPTVRWNDGLGGFQGAPQALLGVGGHACEALFVGDVDGDGSTDVVGAEDANGGGRYVVVRLNLGGAFAPLAVPTGAASAEPVGCADFDGDGAAEILIAEAGPSGVAHRVVALSGGTWTQGPLLDAPAPYSAATTGDVDGDGFFDAAIWSAPSPAPGAAVVALYRGGQGGLGAPILGPGGEAPARVSAIDLDGAPPLEFLIERGARSEVVAAPPASGPVVALPVCPGDHYRALAADFDGDGDADVLGMTSSYAPRLAFNVAGGFVDVDGALPARFAEASRAVLAADVDGDGDLDLVAADFDWVALNDGTGAFAAVAATPPSAPPPQTSAAACAADFDGDGAEDVLLAFAGAPALVVRWGAALVGTATAVGATFVAPRAIAVADVDLDGDLDAVVVDDPSRLVLLRNDGGAWTASDLEASRRVRDVAVADVDDDGDPDLVVACRSLGSPGAGDPSVLLVNQGDGTFVVAALPFAVEADAVGVADVDGGGAPDLLFDGVAYLKVGATYVAAAPGATPVEGLLGAAFVDVDGDGRADACAFEGLRRGVAGFAFGPVEPWPAPLDYLPWPFGLRAPVAAVRPIDLDGDGDLDVIATRPAVLMNRLRHLAHGERARPGRTTSLEIVGVAGASYLLYAAPTRAVPALDLGDVGRLHLEPSQAFVLATGSFDAGGSATPSLAVPNLPQLVGYGLWCQALDLGAGRLTGALRSVVLGL